MIPPIFATDTVDRVRPTMATDHGRQVPDWDADPAADDPITGCSVQPGASDEDNANRSSVTVRYTVFAPLDADIQPGDALRWEGRLYQVDGEPQRWRQLGLAHQVVLLVDWEG